MSNKIIRKPKRAENRKAKPVPPARCEGWSKTGIFQLGGTGRWEQCNNAGIVTLKFKDGGKVKTLPACKKCWAECLTSGVKIIKARPIIS